MKRGIILLVIVLMLLTTACDDIGKDCDEHGVCTGVSPEDQDTLEPELVLDSRPDAEETATESS